MAARTTTSLTSATKTLRAPTTKRVRVVAPSSPFAMERLERGLARLSEAGFSGEAPDDVLVVGHPYLNGSDDVRAAALDRAFAADVDVVWLARGGYGLTRIVSRFVDARRLPDALPLVVGFSDATALHAVLFGHGVPSIHGPLVTTLADESEASLDHLFDLVGGGRGTLAQHPLTRVDAGDDVVVGTALAANLNVLTHLVGTRAMPDLADAVLCIEDVGERPYRIDRMLTQLIESGALADVRALVLGTLTGCEEPASEGRATALAARDVVVERAASAGIPLFVGLPFGHASPNFAIPCGVRIELARDGGAYRLHVLESVYEAVTRRA